MPSSLRVREEGKDRRRKIRVALKPSEWVSHTIKILDGDTGEVIPLEFSERKYLRRVYDTPSSRVLMMTSRQTEKSTTLGNKIITGATMRPLSSTLFVSPSALQTTVFSRVRLDDIVKMSPMINAMTHPNMTMNILEKQFVNQSRVYLRYAFLSADRIRGLSVSDVYCDEIQDLLKSVMPVIEETASHSKNPRYVYSGTPKTFDNTIEKYWSESSTQNEWAIPCTHHGTPKDPGSWHWNILGIKNLGKKGPICDRCGKPIRPDHPYASWVQMQPGKEFEGFRICRLMVPWYWKTDRWNDILLSYERYPLAQFMNEVLACSYDSGFKPLTRSMFQMGVCKADIFNTEAQVSEIVKSHQVYFGIDWGTGESGKSYTVLTVGGYTRGNKTFQILFSRRFTGQYVDPEMQLKEIFRYIDMWKPAHVCMDYGMGFYQNRALMNRYGPQRIHEYQYVARTVGKVVWKAKLNRHILFRTPIMADVINAIRNGHLAFPNYDEYYDPYIKDMTALTQEYSDTMKMVKYDANGTDDTFHTVLYCLLASFFDHKRPDIMAPVKVDTVEDPFEQQIQEELDPAGYEV